MNSRMRCGLCSLLAEPERKLCDACAQMVQRLMLLRELDRLQGPVAADVELAECIRDVRRAAL